jgi:hypothetical protein
MVPGVDPGYWQKAYRRPEVSEFDRRRIRAIFKRYIGKDSSYTPEQQQQFMQGQGTVIVDGVPLTFPQMAARMGEGVFDAAGQPMAMAQAAESVDLSKSGLDVQAAAALRAMETAPTAAAKAAASAEYGRLQRARKEMGRADDRPVDPDIAGLRKDLLTAQVTAAQARTGAGGGRPARSGEATTIADLTTSLNDAATLRATIRGQGGTGAIAQVGAVLPNWVSETTGIGVPAKQRQAVIDRVKQVIGKALEGGVLRKEDEYKYVKILPTIGDPPDVATAKLDGLESAIRQRITTMLDTMEDAGVNVERFRARSERMAPVSSHASPAGQPVRVLAPNGKSYSFSSQEAADAFKRRAGIR